ncbi:MAG TPA: choice-of-anchor V domain-containing protein, partial [Poseidonia sp.]|nr:choice-of-anchor V domain-containing protein [Poseidonia sp.]
MLEFMRKHGLALLLVFLLTSGVLAPVNGHKTGKYNSSSGCSCHTSSNTLTPTLSGEPSEYTPGATYSLSIGISTSHSSGGFSLDASDGIFSNPSSNAQVITGGASATHSTWTSTSWTVDWTAPSTGTGTATLSLAVLGGNGQQNKAGDAVGTASYSIPEIASTNNPPTISNLAIIPQTPSTADNLVASYTFDDIDGNLESGSTYAWTLNGSLMPSLTGSEVSSSQTAKHQSWTVEVTPSDGTANGQSMTSSTAIILNTPPTVTEITPSNQSPTDMIDITYSVNFTDADSDSLTFENQWLLNGAIITELNNATTLPSVVTREGDIWQVRVRANDGEVFSSWTTSDNINIGSTENTPPVADNVAIGVVNPTTTEDLALSWNEFDANEDIITQRSIRWTLDGIIHAPANNLVTLPSAMTTKGESWKGEVRLFDGTSWSSWASSPSVTIINSAPSITNITLFTPSSTVEHDLEVRFESGDEDGDGTEVVSVIWLRNGAVLEGQNQLILNTSMFVKGDSILAILELSDNETTSTANAEEIIILNAAPSVTIQWPSEVTSLDDLTPVVTVTDFDQDQTSIVKTWYKNGFKDGIMDGKDTIISQRTEPEQIWTLAVTANDGTVNSTLVEESITIPNLSPSADIQLISTEIWLGETVILSGANSVDHDSHITDYTWSWQGGSGIGPSFEFILGDSTSVTLTVRDEYGAENQTTLELVAQTGPKVTDFEVLSTRGEVDLSWEWAGDKVQFNVWRNGEQIATVNTTEYHDMPPLSGTANYRIEPMNDGRTFIAGTSEGTVYVEAPIIEAPKASQTGGTGVGILFIFASIAILAPQFLRRGEGQ